MNTNAIPTPRTDAELARLLTDFDLTNIDRREAMADFARLLEKELIKLADNADEFLKAAMADEREQVSRAAKLLLENRELRRRIEKVEVDCAALIFAAIDGREFVAFSDNLMVALQAVAMLRERVAGIADMGAADEKARADWEDGEGAEVSTTSGIWHAAIIYERKRAAEAAAALAAQTSK